MRTSLLEFISSHERTPNLNSMVKDVPLNFYEIHPAVDDFGQTLPSEKNLFFGLFLEFLT